MATEIWVNIGSGNEPIVITVKSLIYVAPW